ncbi:MAG: cysteine desulfurase [Candidatus Komeilibacteria bacterium RIFCSPLOWO2_02_FULL_48_11]|uniref:cysteine desulfurase n=1 Tax=Candidatus Komeilibacteria bacterium RIFCSPLOWO2_02_FULL_48_11 TaxID=1798553 RepID=A0A1G2BVE0_9BACT|nr:MAG: cysteine desulfurase [Candidatus Komeilibacteria bacterium RIFCSPLOWO2_02_FULL_48_11]
MFDISPIRSQFPILSQQINNHQLVYFDNAAMAQMPERVMKRALKFEGRERGNVHSGLHALSQKAIEAYELARQKVARFIGARANEIVFVKNTTEAINLAAYSWARRNLKRGDAIVISELEHHSNILPWKILADEMGVEVRWIPIREDGRWKIEDGSQMMDDRAKLIAIGHVSNAIGTINPIKEIIKIAKDKGIVTLIDGAQAVPHTPIDVKDLGCDFYAFSGYKLYGPTGIGVLYGQRGILEKLPPFLAGGGTILSVKKDEVKWREAPEKLEGGTPNIAGAVGLGEAISFLSEIGMDKIAAHEHELTAYALDKLKTIPEITIYGPKDMENRAGVISFNIKGVHAHDAATMLDEQGIAIRAGHHCAGPLMERLGVPATCRVSFGVYNTLEEIDVLIKALREVVNRFK